MQVSSARTSKDLKPFLFLQIGLFVGTLVNQKAGKQTKVLANKPKCWQTNQNADKQTKILTNKPKYRQTKQFDKTKQKYRSLEVRAELTCT